jgi:hypothetical protein
LVSAINTIKKSGVVSVGLNGATYTKALKSRKEKSERKGAKKERKESVGENKNECTDKKKKKKAKRTNPITKSNTPSAPSHPSTKSQFGIVNDIIHVPAPPNTLPHSRRQLVLPLLSPLSPETPEMKSPTNGP